MTDARTVASGRAFPLTMRIAAIALVGAVVGRGFAVAPALRSQDWSGSALALYAAAAGMIAWCLWWIWHSRTTVTVDGIEQSWIWRKQVAWRDVAQARILALPGLEWLIVPRLVVRVRGGGLLAFHAGDRHVLEACVRFVVTGTAPAPATTAQTQSS